MRAPRKPPALEPGQTIAIIAPASPPEREELLRGAKELERLGFSVRYDPALFARESFFAGKHDRRARELAAAIRDPKISAIFCARGGYGTNYLLGRLDKISLARHPKIFIGYSDVTTLLNYFRQKLGWVVFHGPMVAPDFARGSAGYDFARLEKALMNHQTGWVVPCEAEVLRTGTAQGILVGGCLPMLTETLGTKFELETKGTILFLEDKGSKPYQIDRTLMHLKLAGKLAGVRGIVFGEMLDCQPPQEAGERLEDIVLRVLADVRGPVAFGLRSGHTSGANITLPLGVRARLRAGRQVELEILEPAVSPPKSR